MKHLREGDPFDRFVILRRLADDGLSVSYQARGAAGDVMLEIVSDLDDPDLLDRLKRGAMTVGPLRHAHLLPIVDHGRTRDAFWFATPFAEREDFFSTLRDRHVPLPRVLEILRAAASALDYLHDHGIVYGTLGPRDIQTGPSGTVVAFSANWLAAPGTLPVGNTRYLAAEIVRGETGTAATDVFSLSLLAYEAIAGSYPFGRDPGAHLMRKLLGELDPGPTPRDVPGAMLAVLTRGLAKDPSQRWPRCSDFVEALERAC